MTRSCLISPYIYTTYGILFKEYLSRTHLLEPQQTDIKQYQGYHGFAKLILEQTRQTSGFNFKGNLNILQIFKKQCLHQTGSLLENKTLLYLLLQRATMFLNQTSQYLCNTKTMWMSLTLRQYSNYSPQRTLRLYDRPNRRSNATLPTSISPL